MKTTIIVNINLIWDHRNGVIFDKKEISIDLAFVRLQEEVAFWIESRSFKYRIDRSVWFSSPFTACNM